MRVFLTSDSVAAAEDLRALLDLGGHKVDEPMSSGAGALLAREDWAADAMIAVMSQKKPLTQRRDAILVEIGIALGRGIAVLLLARRELALPSLAGVPRIDRDPNAGDQGIDSLLGTQIDLFLRGVQAGSPRKASRSATNSVPFTPNLPRVLPGRALESEVGDLLRSSGSEIIPQVSIEESGDRADLAVYFSQNESTLGLVLVEVKSVASTADPRRRLRSAANNLSVQVVHARASLGLLIYDGPHVRLSPTPLVASMAVTDLAAKLSKAPLADVLRQARNEAIHAL